MREHGLLLQVFDIQKVLINIEEALEVADCLIFKEIVSNFENRILEVNMAVTDDVILQE